MQTVCKKKKEKIRKFREKYLNQIYLFNNFRILN
jgi:hypothetical protein